MSVKTSIFSPLVVVLIQTLIPVPPTYGVELCGSDVGFVPGGESPEGGLHILGRLNILGLPADHECHVLLEADLAISGGRQL